jgi:hypothetical protein
LEFRELQAAHSSLGRNVSPSTVIQKFIERGAGNHNPLWTKLQVRNLTSLDASVDELSRDASAFRSFIDGVIGR